MTDRWRAIVDSCRAVDFAVAAEMLAAFDHLTAPPSPPRTPHRWTVTIVWVRTAGISHIQRVMGSVVSDATEVQPVEIAGTGPR